MTLTYPITWLTPLAASVGLFLCPIMASAQTEAPVSQKEEKQDLSIISAKKVNATRIDLTLSKDRKMSVDFYGSDIFRLFRDDNGGDMRQPIAKPQAQILVNQPRKKVKSLKLSDAESKVVISTDTVRLEFDKATSLLKLVRLSDGKVLVNQLAAPTIGEKQVSLTLEEHADEYFYGGGVQNGRFSHKGQSIAIENQNSWTDGGVASPNPYYWSTRGYGVMWYTFKKGRYDFGSQDSGKVTLSHQTNYLDL